MCISLPWNRPGQRCQRDAAVDAAFLERYAEALREDASSMSSGIEAKRLTTTMPQNTELPAKPGTSAPFMRTLAAAALLFAGV
ncbi:MAG: hypothetical protein ACK4L7_03575, partial [Flavobacteriales bacterium]